MNDFNENDPFFTNVLFFVIGPLLVGILAVLIWFVATEQVNVAGLREILVAGGVGAAVVAAAYLLGTRGVDWVSEWWKGQR